MRKDLYNFDTRSRKGWCEGKTVRIGTEYQTVCGAPFLRRCAKIANSKRRKYYRLLDKGWGQKYPAATGEYVHHQSVVAEAMEQQRASESRRAAKAPRQDLAAKRLKTEIEKIAAACREAFPGAPESAIEAAVQHSVGEVGSGRVGRSRKVAMTDRVTLLMAAHVRHAMTDYDSLLQSACSERAEQNEEYYEWGMHDLINKDYEGIRRRVKDEINLQVSAILDRWRSPKTACNHPRGAKRRRMI